MSPASHAVGRLRELYGIVLGRMRGLNERSMHPPVGRGQIPLLEPLEQRLMLTTTYAVTPNPATVNEGSGSLSYTVTRSGSLPAETLFASTLQVLSGGQNRPVRGR